MTNTPKTKGIRWGIAGTANIASGKLIPAIHASSTSTVVAVASRSQAKADTFAASNNIPAAYADYQRLIDAPDIDAIYIPLPNHLHVPWAIKAIEAGKHVLCEKPIGLDQSEAELLLAAASQHPRLKIMEAFMYRFHPQWAKAKELLQAGSIGKINSIDAVFTYFNREPENVRNQAGIGGGGVMDIGCYCISASRFLFGREVKQLTAMLDIDEDFGVDRHANGILDFGSGRANIYCSTQSEPSQRIYVSGETGALLIDQPFYQGDDSPAKITVYHDRTEEIFEFAPCDQYLYQIDAFAKAIMHDLPVPTPLSDALENMKVVDAMFTSYKHNSWVTIN